MKTSRVVALSLLLAAAGAGPIGPAEALAAPGRVREPVLASDQYPRAGWYPGLRSLLVLEMHRFSRETTGAPALKSKPVALVAPHAGWRFSGAAAAAAFRSLKPGDFARVVVVAPTHRAAFDGYGLDDASAYRTPLGDIPLCLDAVKKLQEGELARIESSAAEAEHAVEIELPFLQNALKNFCLVPVLAGRTTPGQEKAFAARLAALNDGKTLFVFSSDFTHYGPNYQYTPYGPSAADAREKIRALDQRAIDALRAVDAAGFRNVVDETGATICGHAGLGTLLELLPRIAPKAKSVVFAHFASGELEDNPDKDNSVDYVSMAFVRDEPPAGAPLGPPRYTAVGPDAPPLSEADGQRLVRLARAALQTEMMGADDLSRELAALPPGPLFDRLQGVFVTLNRTRPEDIASSGKLRGCIGTIAPVYPLYSAVVHSAVDAALHDGRFLPVFPTELGALEVEVTALSALKPAPSWTDIRLGTHGIVLRKSGRGAVFLPQVAGEQGWTLEQTLGHLSEKAGLPADAWKDGAQFLVFTGQVFEEKKTPAEKKP